MRNIEKIIRPYCYKIIPLIYDDSLSYYEVLCKLREKLNEVIDEINSGDDVDIDIEQIVTDILNKWLEDGTLEQIIKDVMNDVEETNITPEYVSTFTYPCAVYDTSFVSFDVIQSFCFIDANTAVGVRNSRHSTDNTIKIFKFNPETGLNIGYDSNINGGHANDITYDGKYLYITWLYDYEGTTVNKVTVCDTNFNFVKTVTPPDIPYTASLSYNSETEKFYAYCANQIYVYNKDLDTLLEQFHIDYSYYKNYYNYANRFLVNTISSVIDGILVNCSYPSVTFKIDYSGKLLKVYNYANFYENGFNTLELEKALYNPYNRYYYILSYAVQGLGDFANNTYGRFSLEKGQVAEICVSATTRPNYYTSSQRIYVNNSINDNAKMLGTYQFPFKYLQQAIDCKTMIENPCTIDVLNINTADNLGTICISNESNVRISRYPDEVVTTTKTLIPRAEIINCSDIQIFYQNIGTILIGNSVGVTMGRTTIVGGRTVYLHSWFIRYCTIHLDSFENTGVMGRNDGTNNLTYDYEVNCYDLGTAII